MGSRVFVCVFTARSRVRIFGVGHNIFLVYSQPKHTHVTTYSAQTANEHVRACIIFIYVCMCVFACSCPPLLNDVTKLCRCMMYTVYSDASWAEIIIKQYRTAASSAHKRTHHTCASVLQLLPSPRLSEHQLSERHQHRTATATANPRPHTQHPTYIRTGVSACT